MPAKSKTAAAPDLLIVLQEALIFHYGTEAERADQRERWNHLSGPEMAEQMEHDMRTAISEAEGR